MATSGGFGGFAVDSIERIAQTQAEKSSGQKRCNPASAASAEWIAPKSPPGMLTETFYFIMLYLSRLFPWDLPQFFKFWKNEVLVGKVKYTETR